MQRFLRAARALPFIAAGLWLAFGASAQERPDESALFGAPAPPPDAGAGAESGALAPALDAGVASPSGRPSEADLFAAQPADPTPKQPPPAGDRDAESLSGPAAQSRFDTEEEKADPLDLGGTLYLRGYTTYRERDSISGMPLSAPALVDAYLDARPSERVRGMVLARMQYDLVQPAESHCQLGDYALGPSRPNPSIALDQLWIRFDIERAAFLTIGKQHVRWGASRFWNPTDFLSPERKDALALFDARLGANMVKLHVPWESKGWNFYAIGLLDNAGPADRLGKLGAAGRAELVFGEAELGVDAVVVNGRKPRYGVDLSSALGPIDVYGEVAIRHGDDFTVWREKPDASELPLIARFESSSLEGVQLLASGGFTYSFNYTERNMAILGAEYFYNPAGADTARLYPWLIFSGSYQPFYAGQHYAALYAVLPGLPGGLDRVMVTLSNLGNLSDASFVSRLDVQLLRVAGYLNLETYAAAHYGNRGGEFRFGLELEPQPLGDGRQTPPVSIAAPVFEAGVGLRVSL